MTFIVASSSRQLVRFTCRSKEVSSVLRPPLQRIWTSRITAGESMNRSTCRYSTTATLVSHRSLTRVSLPRTTMTTHRELCVWNSSFLDDVEAQELATQIRQQQQSCERLQEELASMAGSESSQWQLLNDQYQLRHNQLQQLLLEYKAIAGEEYHLNDNFNINNPNPNANHHVIEFFPSTADK